MAGPRCIRVQPHAARIIILPQNLPLRCAVGLGRTHAVFTRTCTSALNSPPFLIFVRHFERTPSDSNPAFSPPLKSLRASESNRIAHEKNRTDFGCIRLQPHKFNPAIGSACTGAHFCDFGEICMFAILATFSDFARFCDPISMKPFAGGDPRRDLSARNVWSRCCE